MPRDTRRLAVAAFVALVAAACRTAAPPPKDPVLLGQPGVGAAPTAQSLALNYSAERIWAALPRAYKAVGITVNAIDSTTRAIGFAGTIRRELAGVRLSTFFRCGNQMGENADSYDVSIFIATQVGREPQGTNIRITTGVRVSARSPAFASTTTMCTSTGELERRVHAALEAELGQRR